MPFADLTVMSRAELSYNITPNAHFAPSVVMSFAVTLYQIRIEAAVKILFCKVAAFILYHSIHISAQVAVNGIINKTFSFEGCKKAFICYYLPDREFFKILRYFHSCYCSGYYSDI